MGTFTWKSGFCLGRCSRKSGNFVSNATSQVLGTRLVQADSYPTWFENVAVVAVEVMVVVGRRPGGLPASETFSCRPARALSPAGRGRGATCTTPGWSAEEDLLSHRKIGS